LFTKANKESIDEGAAVDVIIEFPKLIADCFDALAEDSDRRVTLGAGAELDVKRVDAHIRVVLEELLKRGPKFSGGSVVVGDRVEELSGDSGVNPLDDR
jgi:hypothetical protein